MSRREAPVSPPVVLTIAGSDSGGGAGVQADLKTIEACGGFGTSAITSVTAQNTRGVEGSHLLPVADIEAQIEAVRSDFDVAAVKTGMLATSDVVDLVADRAPDLPNLVVDPVMVAASGDRLLQPEAEDAYEDLLAHAALVTPNADEAEVLTGVAVADEDSATEAGRILVEDHGANAALVKGGHVPGEVVADVLVTGDGAITTTATTTTATTITHERVDTDATHGSGCTLSSAIATELAHDADLREAVTAGIDLLASAVRYNVDVGEGPGSVHHLVALRDDAGLGETVDALDEASDRLADPAFEPLASETDDTLVGATPYAETPADTVSTTVPLGQSTESRTAGTFRGEDDTAARVLLAVREAVPAVRYCLACRYDEAVDAALEALDWGMVTPDPGADDRGDDGDSVARTVGRRAEGGTDRPVAVGAPEATRTFVVAASTDALLDAARSLADATTDVSGPA